MRHPRHHQTAERRRCAGPLRLQHCGFGSRCQLCSQDTHWLQFSVFVDALHNHEAITTLSPGGLLFGRRMAAPPERHRLGLLRRRRAARAARSSLLQVQGVGTRSQDTHHLSSFFLSVSSDTPGCEGACCARAGLRSGWAALSSRSVYIIAAGHLLGSSQDTHTENSLSHVCLAMHCYEGCVFSPLHGCLVLYFARHACSFLVLDCGSCHSLCGLQELQDTLRLP